MRILLLSTAISNHTKKWANSLVKRGHEIMVVCRGDMIDQKHEFSKDIKVHYLKYGGGIGYYLNVFEFKKICNSFKPDIVNAHYATGYGTLARLANVRPLVISCWGSDIFEYPHLSKINKYILTKNLNHADAVASTSITMAEAAKQYLKDDKKEITVTPFGVDVNRFCVNPIPHERPVIGFVKYLEHIYDVPLLIKAFSIVYHSEEVKPVLEIIGDGPLKNELIALTEELGIRNAVVFKGLIPNLELPEHINKMDIFVNCSKQESFGVALVEAMACGVPVIATDTEGFREVVADGVTGFVLKDREPETMAEAMRVLLHDKQLRERMGAAGRNRVLDLYDWEKNVQIMENLYRSLI